MADWVDVTPYGEFQPGSVHSVDVDGTPVAVFNLEGTCYAIEDTCPHDGGVLTGGDVEGDEVICPRHGARFCIKTGKVLAPPAYEDVAVFAVRVEAGMVQVRDARWDEGFS
ncbi:non-heme iron oxygenase ferredoxin subunit [Paraburkholderia sp. J8-2]|uniref:non-heme iron oxygenase ferredoxin subunit n=1 Tax=Paraburkholderia sp. J8-2 TaxID=2805440 RepID=UPI002AB7ED71|nr:non-heme iron oxygenase ferredoxin subunit [Paraburkholderia sp. J8-2]